MNNKKANINRFPLVNESPFCTGYLYSFYALLEKNNQFPVRLKLSFSQIENSLIDSINILRFNRPKTSMTELKQAIQDFYRKERFGHNKTQQKVILEKLEVVN